MRETITAIMTDVRSRAMTEDTETHVTPDEVESLKANCTVILPAGGRGTRIRAETHSEEINKVMINVDEKHSLIQKTVYDYAQSGVADFVVLTGFLAKKVENHLGDGSEWGVSIRYSKDPEGRKVGNAGAILNALQNEVIDDSRVAIVHNPDDIIVGLEKPYGNLFLEGHAKARKNGCLATMVVVPETQFQYSGMVIDRGKVRDITKYPIITIPAHTGVSVLDPGSLDYFRELVSLESESSFEAVVCPVLAEEEKLFAISIPSSCWFAVNDLKGLEAVREALTLTTKEHGAE
ncbi:MAG: NDP-sugar synthase [Candidatus Hermodarchaeota archaeon]